MYGSRTVNHFNLNEVYNLTAETIFDIKQDESGVMWFGTNEGLISFNGLEFRTYIEENHAIAYHNIKFDSEGGVWCSNFGGQLFRVKDNTIDMVYNASSQGDFIYDYLIGELPVIYIVESNDGKVVTYDIETKTEKKVFIARAWIPFF